MARKKVELTTRHQINFGTAETPDYKTKGDVVECEANQADSLVSRGYAKYVEQQQAAKREAKADGHQ